MTSYILIEVEDEEQVKTFLEDTKRLLEGGASPWVSEDHRAMLLTGGQENTVAYKIQGVWRKPTKFCECTPEAKQQWRKEHDGRPPYTTGQKYGWRICIMCAKAMPHHTQTPRNIFRDRPVGILRHDTPVEDTEPWFWFTIWPGSKYTNEHARKDGL